jgi:hypothetical protein
MFRGWLACSRTEQHLRRTGGTPKALLVRTVSMSMLPNGTYSMIQTTNI